MILGGFERLGFGLYCPAGDQISAAIFSSVLVSIFIFPGLSSLRGLVGIKTTWNGESISCANTLKFILNDFK